MGGGYSFFNKFGFAAANSTRRIQPADGPLDGTVEVDGCMKHYQWWSFTKFRTWIEKCLATYL